VPCNAVQMLLIRHILDVMHCEKSLCKNMVKTIMGKKDSPGSRQDLEDLDIRQELWLQEARKGGDSFFMPGPSYNLTSNYREIEDPHKLC
jgi:hypothetical protein